MKSRSTRFGAGPLDYALIEFDPRGGGFNANVVALVINESYTGASLVLKTELILQEGLKVCIKVGQLDPMDGVIVWVKDLEEGLYRVGVQYRE